LPSPRPIKTQAFALTPQEDDDALARGEARHADHLHGDAVDRAAGVLEPHHRHRGVVRAQRDPGDDA
jgi:hypothetical protein